MTVAGLLAGGSASGPGLRSHLDASSAAQRVAECQALSPSELKHLYAIASAEPAAAALLLAPDDEVAVFAGRNSLQLFTRFEKCFGQHNRTTVGYNRHPLSWLIGPGYFTVEPQDNGALLFDYARVPADPPPGWPASKPNAGLFSRPVYGHLTDRVLWVSADVLIGSAFRSGTPLDSYFILARLPPAAKSIAPHGR